MGQEPAPRPMLTPSELTALGLPTSFGAKCSLTYMVLSENSGPSAPPSKSRQTRKAAMPEATAEAPVKIVQSSTLIKRLVRTLQRNSNRGVMNHAERP